MTESGLEEWIWETGTRGESCGTHSRSTKVGFCTNVVNLGEPSVLYNSGNLQFIVILTAKDDTAEDQSY